MDSELISTSRTRIGIQIYLQLSLYGSKKLCMQGINTWKSKISEQNTSFSTLLHCGQQSTKVHFLHLALTQVA